MSSREIHRSDDSFTMQEIYESHFNSLEYNQSEFVFVQGHNETSKQAWEVHRNIKQSFPTLSNSFLVMYVFPHLNPEDDTPIPGYWTSFPLYDSFEIALPGEEVRVGDND